MTEPYEGWRDIPGFENLYQVSRTGGQVRSLPRNTTRGKILRQSRNSHGYWQVSLSKDGKHYTRTVHCLVLLTFRGPCPPGYQACHGPRGQDDNSLDNLSYGTAEQNQLDRIRDGTSNRGERSAQSKLTEAIVAECRRRYAAGETQTALSAEFGVSTGAMSMAIRGKRWGYARDSVPVTTGKPSQQTPEFRTRMSERGKRGAAARWKD